MGLSAAIVWEVRTTGSQTNGGGFKTGATGTDYSQQAAAQYALNAVAAAGASAVMTHASAAAAMVGNVCRVVSGTNATAGWYEIISVNVGVDITVDRNWCTGACANGVVNVGGAFKIGGALDDEFFEAKVPGNTVHVASGTYTFVEEIQVTAGIGTAQYPITWIGYKTTRNDVCLNTDRPLFVCGAFKIEFPVYSIVRNFRVTIDTLTGLYAAHWSKIINCKSEGTATGIRIGQKGRIIACEAKATAGNAIFLDQYAEVIASFAHDSVAGIYCIADAHIFGCVVDTCTTGLVLNNYHDVAINNTIYNCTLGISGANSYEVYFLNNIITDCDTGASWTTAMGTNFWDYNCWNNTTDVSNVTKGPHDITADPKLKDPVNNDFTLKGGSPCFGTGLSLSSDVGLA